MVGWGVVFVGGSLAGYHMCWLHVLPCVCHLRADMGGGGGEQSAAAAVVKVWGSLSGGACQVQWKAP